MRLAGYQPQYFPRLHYFARIIDADVFEISDCVEYVKKHKYQAPDGSFHRDKSYQADAPIKLGTGLFHLTVPAGHHQGVLLNEAVIADDGWQRKHLKAITQGYGRAPRFAELYPQIERLLQQKYQSLADLNSATIAWALGVLLGLNQSYSIVSLEDVAKELSSSNTFRLSQVIRISAVGVPPPGDYANATEWIIDMCRYFGANEYYFGGTSANAYMNFSSFSAAGISVVQQDWLCNPYQQQFTRHGFLGNLSIIDLLMNESNDTAHRILAGA